MNFLKSNFWEIDRSVLLHKLGATLSLLHILNYFYWSKTSHFINAPSARPLLCWDFFSNCTSTFSFHHSGITTLFTAYLITAAFSFALFAWNRFVRLSWTFLLMSTLLQIFFYIFDASLAQDVFALLILLNLGFLFAPSKAVLTRMAIVAYYLILGYRELSPEWLSGASLHAFMPFPYKALEWIAAIGVIVKLTLPFLLISPFGQRLTMAVVGLSLYQIFFFYFKHDYQPVALILLNIFFVFDYIDRKRLERESLYQSYAHPEPSKFWWPVVLGLYLFFQTPFIPRVWPTEILRISGPKATTHCQYINFARYDNRLEHVTDILPENVNSDLKCRALLAFHAAKEACIKRKDQPDFQSLSSFFLARKFTETNFKLVFSVDNICPDSTQYKTIVVTE